MSAVFLTSGVRPARDCSRAGCAAARHLEDDMMSDSKQHQLSPLPNPAPLRMEQQDLSPPTWLQERMRQVYAAWRRLPSAG